MNTKYANWIEQNVSPSAAYGGCAEITLQMQATFPELHRVRGHYHDALWGKRDHWWLIDTDGDIVDPTAIQFPTRGTGEYVEWDDSQPEPTGKCPNCGGLCYGHRYLCSDACDESYRAYVMGGRPERA